MKKLFFILFVGFSLSAFGQMNLSSQVAECKIPDNYNYKTAAKDFEDGGDPDDTMIVGDWVVVGMASLGTSLPTKYDCGGARDENNFLVELLITKDDNLLRTHFKYANIDNDITEISLLDVDKFSFQAFGYRQTSFFTECRKHPSKEGYLSCLASLNVTTQDGSSQLIPAWTWEFKRKVQ